MNITQEEEIVLPVETTEPTNPVEQLPEFATLDAAAKALGIKKSLLNYYIRTLGLEKKHFEGNKHAFISRKAALHIQAVREHPWTIQGENV